jgi:hypothetical protein
LTLVLGKWNLASLRYNKRDVLLSTFSQGITSLLKNEPISFDIFLLTSSHPPTTPPTVGCSNHHGCLIRVMAPHMMARHILICSSLSNRYVTVCHIRRRAACQNVTQQSLRNILRGMRPRMSPALPERGRPVLDSSQTTGREISSFTAPSSLLSTTVGVLN